MKLFSAVLHTLLANRQRRSAPLFLAATLLTLAVGQIPARAEGMDRRPDPERRAALQRQQAEAMAKLSSQQRQAYFADLRQLEQRLAAERLDQLGQRERCIVPARTLAAIETCQRNLQQQAMEQRRRWMAERAELQRRFGLPGWNPRSQQRQGA